MTAALAWGYVFWLAADMDMGGMNMSGVRMIPAGRGLMTPAAAPWSGVEFVFVFVMWAQTLDLCGKCTGWRRAAF